jgi:hypothetical protein
MWGRFVEGEKSGYFVKAAHIAVMTNLAAKFGLSPVDRVKVKARPAEKPTNPWARLKGESK